MFGVLPASGLYMRYATDVTLDNINMQLEEHDKRSVMVFDTVNHITIRNMILPKTDESDQMTLIDSEMIQISSPTGKHKTLSASGTTGFNGF